jgi:hypothetical protein
MCGKHASVTPQQFGTLLAVGCMRGVGDDVARGGALLQQQRPSGACYVWQEHRVVSTAVQPSCATGRVNVKVLP